MLDRWPFHRTAGGFNLSGGIEGEAGPALGGLTWQSLTYSIWEQLLCVSVIMVFLKSFWTHANRISPILMELAKKSNAAYLIHPLVLVVFCALIDFIRIHPLGKISLALLPGLVLTFLPASLLRRPPGPRQILFIDFIGRLSPTHTYDELISLG